MNFIDALKISSSGMTAQRVRMTVISSNLANMHTTRTPEGGPYKRKDVVFTTESVESSFSDVMRETIGAKQNGVKVAGVINDAKKPLLKYNPGHPDADEKGYVAIPNINMMEEMVNLLSATRGYEANTAAIKPAKDMALKALEIGK